jgi:hypothetical protein
MYPLQYSVYPTETLARQLYTFIPPSQGGCSVKGRLYRKGTMVSQKYLKELFARVQELQEIQKRLAKIAKEIKKGAQK